MLVSHTEDHITHAVIGGKKTMNFGISDDPAFFQILSSALYKDPMLAMVRETICNAWDAHIEAGRTDVPLIITLDDDHLTIRDFGPGIPEDLIQPIYGVYGASTKKNDGRQTGGFGLGCKSPFAYTDHFEVTSCHGGVKTIYTMSKSSAEVGGKPSIVPIASFPSDEHGITVRIPLNPDKAIYRLSGMIREVIFNGDIKALVNDETPETIGLSKAECGFVLINEYSNGYAHHLSEHRIFVRYGNVIYPVERSSEIDSLHRKVANLLKLNYGCHMVMQAPADSISITPSRESLTMSEITINTLNELMSNFLAVFFKNRELMVRHKEMVEKYVDTAAQAEAPIETKIPLGEWMVPGIPVTLNQSLLYTKEDFALLEVLLRYGDRKGLDSKVWFNFIKRYFNQMIGQEGFNRGLYQKWESVAARVRKHMRSPNTYRRLTDSTESAAATLWWQKEVLAPLVQELMLHVPGFNRQDLYFVSDRTDSPIRHTRIAHHTHNLVHLLTPTVVITHNAKTIFKRMSYVDRGGSNTLTHNTYFIIEVGRKKGELDKVLDGLKQVSGIHLVDVTGRLPHEQAEHEERQAKIQASREAYLAGRTTVAPLVKKSRPGLVRMDHILDETNRRIDTRILVESTDPVRITEPEFVIQVSTGKDCRHTTADITYPTVLYAVAKLFGSKGAVTNKSDALERFKKKGAMNMDQYLVDKVVKQLETSPTLNAYFQACPSKMADYLIEKLRYGRCSHMVSVVETMSAHPVLRALMPKQVDLSEEDQHRITIWEYIKSSYTYSYRDDVRKVRTKLEAITLSQEITDFLDKLIANPFLGLIDFEWLGKNLRQNREDPVFTNQCITFVKSILN